MGDELLTDVPWDFVAGKQDGLPAPVVFRDESSPCDSSGTPGPKMPESPSDRLKVALRGYGAATRIARLMRGTA